MMRPISAGVETLLSAAAKETQAARTAIEKCIAEGNLSLALHYAELLWRAAPDLATAGFIKTRAKTLASGLNFTTKRVAILRSFTVESMTPLLETVAAFSRMSLEVVLGQYNAYIQELMSPADGPVQNADLVIVALHTRTAAPVLWAGGAQDDMQAASDWLCENLSQALHTYREVATAPILLQLLDTPSKSAQTGETLAAQRAVIAATNDRLRETAAAIPDCHAFDIDDLVAHPTRQTWHDERNWTIGKVPFRADRAPELALRWFQLSRPLLETPSKVIVTDLDNTLWGGILGEDGPENLRMEAGTGYRKIQEIMRDLKNRGFLLAIASKNDETAVLPILQRHPECLIRPEDIVAHRINWSPKSTNLRAIAEELRLSLDSFVFLDDNPAERAQMALELPMVRILPHSDDPFVTASMLASHPDLQRLKVTAEDTARTQLYRNRQAANISTTPDPMRREAFLQSLQQEIRIEPLSDETFTRIAELERKTNQFNLRTRRFTEAQLRAFAAGPQAFVLAFRVVDRFGDNGVVGLAVVSIQAETATIENLLMSCRVIGRDVEFAMAQEVTRQAAQRGAKKILGAFAPTAKNEPASQFYANAGFSPLSVDGDIEYWHSALK